MMHDRHPDSATATGAASFFFLSFFVFYFFLRGGQAAGFSLHFNH